SEGEADVVGGGGAATMGRESVLELVLEPIEVGALAGGAADVGDHGGEAVDAEDLVVLIKTLGQAVGVEDEQVAGAQAVSADLELDVEEADRHALGEPELADRGAGADDHRRGVAAA